MRRGGERAGKRQQAGDRAGRDEHSGEEKGAIHVGRVVQSGPPRLDALRGFGITSENVSLLKNTSFGHEGRYKLQFRVEFYNLFNRHTFANPITDLTSPEFGFVPGVSSTPRNGQFGVRFEF